MRVLFLCHRFPFPPARGGKIRPFNIIRHLQERHEVTVASLARSEEEAQAGLAIAPHCSRFIIERVAAPAALGRMVTRLPTLEPSSMGYFYSPPLARRLKAEIERSAFDLIFVHCSSVAPYVANVEGIQKILDFGDMDSQKWLLYARARRFPLSAGYLLEGLKLRRAEARLAARFTACTCTTRAELDTLLSYGTAPRAGWFPNGVDAEYFAPTADPYDPDTITFVGRMDYYPNQECMFAFCHDTLPLVLARRPSARLLIVGANPSRAVRALGRLPGVTVTGSVPDVRPYLRASAVTVAPLRIARGTQNKILEAMAMGVPTVASEVAAGGVDAEPDHHLLTASAPEHYAKAILRLLDNPEERRRFAEAGRARMLSHHSWEGSMRKLDGLLDQWLGPGAGATRRPDPAVAGGNGASRQ